MAKKISIQLDLKVPPAEVFRAFTNATVLREWLCDVATVGSREGGRVYLWWDHGNFIAGKFTKFIPNEKLEIRCQGCNEPTPTRIRIGLEPLEKGTRLILKESGFSDDAEGKNLQKLVERRWERSLENLVNVLEKGPDLRVINRPMLGIFLGAFNEKVAAKIGVPVVKGVIVEGLVEGMGAQTSGVQKKDVIVAMDGKPTPDLQSLTNLLQKHKAGDTVETQLYRKNSLKTLWVTLSYRPIPEIPKTPRELADTLGKVDEEKFNDLKKCLEGISEEMACTSSKKGEWSACDVVAHLIHSERDRQSYIHNVLFDQEPVSDDYGDNLDSHISATVSAFGSLKAILEEYRRSLKETTLFVAGISSEFVKHKGSYWRLAFNLLSNHQHIDEHISQIQKTFETLKKKTAIN
jgi:uncharacterized protein YndB with AHSA1/START domain